MNLLNTDALVQAARRISAHAQHVRAEADRLVRAVQASAWRGNAAAAFQAHVGGLAANIHACADALDDAAAALRHHAATAEHEAHELEGAAEAAEDVVGFGLRMLGA